MTITERSLQTNPPRLGTTRAGFIRGIKENLYKERLLRGFDATKATAAPCGGVCVIGDSQS